MTQQEQQQPQHFMAELYRRHERLMYYIAGNYTTDAFQREDIVQAALVALMRNEATLRTLSEPARLSYIAAAVRNTAINARKRTQRETAQCVSMEDLPEELPQTQLLGAESKYLEKERREALLAKFRELPEPERQLLFGRYMMDLTDAELAAMLGCKSASVRMKLTRARRALLEKLREGGLDND